MDLSIVIVSWNVREHLARCLASIERLAEEAADKEKGISFEVLVVDNASTDGTREWLTNQESRIKNNPNLLPLTVRGSERGLQVIHNSENLGFAAANNQAIRQARGEFILLLNPDTEVCPSLLNFSPSTLGGPVTVLPLREHSSRQRGTHSYAAPPRQGGAELHKVAQTQHGATPFFLWKWIDSLRRSPSCTHSGGVDGRLVKRRRGEPDGGSYCGTTLEGCPPPSTTIFPDTAAWCAAREAEGRIPFSDNPLRALLSFMRAHPKCGILGPMLRNADGTVQPSVRRFPRAWDPILFSLGVTPKKYCMADFDYTSAREVDQVMGACFFIRRTCLEAIGLLDERFFIWFEEVDYCRRAKEAGWEVRYTPDTSVLHHGGESFAQMLTTKKQWIYSRSLLRYFAKYHAWGAWVLNALLVIPRLCIALLLYRNAHHRS